MLKSTYKVGFKIIKNEWDEIYKEHKLEEIPWHTNNPDKILVRLIRQKKIKRGSVLDMCSGDGTNSIYLASKGFKVFGIDISPTAVKIAKARCSKRNQKCKYLVGDVLKIRLKEKFDLIFDRGCFHHISNKEKPKYVEKVKDLLKKKGKFYLRCFSDKNPPFYKNLQKKNIINYFSKYFNIIFIKDTVHTEPISKFRRHLYAVFMEKG